MENLENRKTYRRVRLNSTVKLMTSTDPKERLKAEYQQLLIIFAIKNHLPNLFIPLPPLHKPYTLL